MDVVDVMDAKGNGGRSNRTSRTCRILSDFSDKSDGEDINFMSGIRKEILFPPFSARISLRRMKGAKSAFARRERVATDHFV